MRMNITLILSVVALMVLFVALLFAEGGEVEDSEGTFGRNCVVGYEDPDNATSCLLGPEVIEF